MSRVARYQEQKPKLNLRKVFGVILVFLILAGLVFGIVYAINGIQIYQVKRSTLKHYFVSFEESTQKYGVIDAAGEVVLENKYDELILIPDQEKDLFLVIENVNYDEGTYEVNALNKNGNIVIKGYEELRPIEYIGNTAKYDNNLLKFVKQGKIGLVRFDGTEVFKNVFETVETMQNIENRLLVKEDGKYGIINTETADYIVPTLYRSVEPIVEDKNTAYIVKFDEKAGVFSSAGKEILPGEYDNIEKINSLDFFKATKNKETNIFNKEGKIVYKGDVKNIVEIKDNLIIHKTSNKVGAIDFNKKEVIPFKYQSIIPASVDKYIVKLNNKFNIRSKELEKLLDQEYNSIVFNSEAQIYIASNDSVADVYDIDLALKVQGVISKIDEDKGFIEIYKDEELKIYNFQFDEKTEKDVYPDNNLYLFKDPDTNKYGYVNEAGKVVVDAKYDDAKFQNKYGFIAVSKDNKWGVLNYNGAVIIDTILDLSDYLVIDFIKDWHYDKDLTLNIYIRENITTGETE